MLFNSFEFVFVFLSITLLIYYFLAGYQSAKMAIGFLVAASLAFYSYWAAQERPE